MNTNCLTRQRVFTIGFGFRLLCALAFFFTLSTRAATIQFYMTNSLGVADTNAFRVTPISTPILADGSFLVTGVPVRITPNASGFAQTNLQRGNYVVSNSFVVGNWGTGVNPIGSQRGVIFAVPNSSGTYSFTSNAISGGNVYNYNGAQFVATYSNIVTELGFTPLSTNDARNIFPTNTFAAGNNVTFTTNAGVVTVASTATGGASTNTISAGTLVTVTTNTPNYVVSALSQTNNFTTITTSNANTFALTNDSRILTLTNVNNIINARIITNGVLYFQENQGGFWRIKTNGLGNLQWDNSTDSGFIIIGTDGTLTASLNLIGDIIAADVGFSGDGTLISNVTAKAVLAAVTNSWRVDSTNAVLGLAGTNVYNAGEGLTFSTNGRPVTVSVSAGTTNRFAFTNLVYGVSNYVFGVSNSANIHIVGTSNKLVTASNALFGFLVTTSNKFDVLVPTNSGSDGQVISKTGTNVQWATASGGSGTGVQTNSGAGTNNYFTTPTLFEPTHTSTNVNLAMESIIAGGNHAWADNGAKYVGILSGRYNHITNNTDYAVIVGGQGNYISTQTGYSFIGGGMSNMNTSVAGFLGGGRSNELLSVPPASGVLVGGVLNTNRQALGFIGGGISNNLYATYTGSVIPGGGFNGIAGSYGFAAGFGARISADNVFAWSDGVELQATVARSFIVQALNGVGINTNQPLGNALNVNGRINAPTYTMMALTNAQVNTNIVVIQGSGTVAVNGMYYYQGPQYTNRMTGATITNNAGTWVIKDASLTSIDSSTSLISTNWTVLVSTGVPRSDYGTFLYGNGPWIGEFFSTNADTRYIHPTNTGTDSQFIVKTGNDSQWSSSAGITNITGNAATATTATNVIGLPKTNIVYVSPYGSDSTGNGTFGAPFLSISNAAALASQLATAYFPSNASNHGEQQMVQCIHVLPGIYLDRQIPNNTNIVFEFDAGTLVRDSVSMLSGEGVFNQSGYPLTILGYGTFHTTNAFSALVYFPSNNTTTNFIQADYIHNNSGSPLLNGAHGGRIVIQAREFRAWHAPDASDAIWGCTNNPDLTFNGPSKISLGSDGGTFVQGNAKSGGTIIFHQCDVLTDALTWWPVAQSAATTLHFNGGSYSANDASEGYAAMNVVFNGTRIASSDPKTDIGAGVLSGSGFLQQTNLTFFSEINSFTSTNIPIGSATIYTVPHGLTLIAAPSRVRAVLVCVTNDAASGYLAGDEVDVFAAIDSNVLAPVGAFVAGLTNVGVSFPEAPDGNEAAYNVAKRSGGTASPSRWVNFAVKFYVSP